MTNARDVHVIAEAGTNHGGSLSTGMELIDIAADAGADSVKFQIIHPDGLYLRDLWLDGQLVHNDVFDAREASMLPDSAWAELAGHARKRGLGFAASVFDDRGLAILESVDADYIKIASCDLNNGPLLRKAAVTGRRLVVATGMSTFREVTRAVEHLGEAGAEDVVLLHCMSIYPSRIEEVHLGFLESLKTFGVPVGFSDHTENSVAAVMAVALGATWLEKHITFDRSAPGFDHSYAMEPPMFAEYIKDVRGAAAAIAGNRDPAPEAEGSVRQRARRGLWAARDVPEGTVIGTEHVLVVRPEGPLGPNDLDRIVGRRLRVSLRQGEPFSGDSVELGDS